MCEAGATGNKNADGEVYIVIVKVLSIAKLATVGLNAVDVHVVGSVEQTYPRDTQDGKTA